MLNWINKLANFFISSSQTGTIESGATISILFILLLLYKAPASAIVIKVLPVPISARIATDLLFAISFSPVFFHM